MNKIPCKKYELDLLCTLSGGQSFRWNKRDEKWIGVFAHKLWVLHQDDQFLYYEVLSESKSSLDSEKIKTNHKGKVKSPTTEINDHLLNASLLKQYFRLDDIQLAKAYPEWAANDSHFQETATKFQGIRILNQDPVENVFSFICSSNNNINRISSMVEKLCLFFGRELTSIDGKTYCDFPTLEKLTEPSVENKLREAGFGYRARFVHESAVKILQFGGVKWLYELRALPYIEAKSKLMQLPGVGAKVADCICLMSLGFLEAVPVDTHIFQVAAEWYLPHLRKCKSVTPRIYDEIGDYFRKLYGPYAGWAHTILFCSNLKKFTGSLSSEDGKQRRKKRKV